MQHIRLFLEEFQMAIRKRIWTTRRGEQREAWIFDYSHHGTRHQETFATKREALEARDQVGVDRRSGSHTPRGLSPTVKAAGEAWIESARAAELQRATIQDYDGHLRNHILPDIISGKKLTDISVDDVKAFQGRLQQREVSRAMRKKILTSLGALIAESGATRNAVREMRRGRKGKRTAKVEQRKKLEVGVDIPLPGEITAIIAHAKRNWRPLLLVAAFTGLRAGELRGLVWKNVDLNKREIHVRQRADKFKAIDAPKSTAGERVVPFGATVANTLKTIKGRHGGNALVFGNGQGNVEENSNIRSRGLIPAVIAAGLFDEKGEPKYTGLHSLRHFYASWCANSVASGGLGLSMKEVQERMGHSSITITMDRYSHLFPRHDDRKELDDAELRLISGNAA
jgi:integrase